MKAVLETLQVGGIHESTGAIAHSENDLGRAVSVMITPKSRRDKSELLEAAKILRRSGMKQKEIARQLGVSQQTVSNFLREDHKKPIPKKNVSRQFNLSLVLDHFLGAIADGGAIENKNVPRRVLNRLVHAGVLRKSTVPQFYVLTDKAIDKLARGREFNFIRFFLFDVLHFDRLGAEGLEYKFDQIRDIWKRRTS